MANRQLMVGVLLTVCLAYAGAGAASDAPPPPGPKDRCATCGMFVAKYPSWVAAIVYADGSRRYFDGPKDLFRFRAREETAEVEEAEIWITDYYTAQALMAKEAVFVRGSDVMGPMGAELVPLASMKLAEGFRADHGGEAPLAFDEIDEAVIRSLE